MVSEHYQGQPDARATLIKHIKHGTRGLWANIAQGQVMPGFAGRMSDAEIEIVVDYILGLAE